MTEENFKKLCMFEIDKLGFENRGLMSVKDMTLSYAQARAVSALEMKRLIFFFKYGSFQKKK